METNRYLFSVLLQVEVEAFDSADAKEAIEDAFGAGESCGLNVQDYEVLDFDEIT